MIGELSKQTYDNIGLDLEAGKLGASQGPCISATSPSCWHWVPDAQVARTLLADSFLLSTWRKRPIGAPMTHIKAWSGGFPEGVTTVSISVMATTVIGLS